MKSLLSFVKTAIAGGFFVLLPLLLLYLLLDELLDVLLALASPLHGVLPAALAEIISNPLLLSIVLLLAASFIFGLALRSSILLRWGQSLEETTLGQLSLYRAVKKLSQGLLGQEKGFACAVYNDGSSRQLVYVIENQQGSEADDDVTIMTPYAPAGLTGCILIVKRASLSPLKASMGDVSGVMANFGDGAQALAKQLK